MRECTENRKRRKSERIQAYDDERGGQNSTKKAQVKEMWLTHFSPSLVHPEEYMDGVREIFPNSYVGKDGKSVDLLFEEEENE